MPYHDVGPNESVPSLAREYGLFWETIWDHPNNSDYRSARKNPNVLREGDVIFVPDIKLRQESRATDEKHRFKRKGVPIKIRLRMLKLDKPRANEGYVIEIDGKKIQGKTDGDGVLEHYVPNHVHEANLHFGAEEYKIEIGTLDPIDEITGVQHRLNNLGFDCGDEIGRLGPQTQMALKSFQTKNGLEVTGQVDEPTKKKLNELHQ
jgi:hypothetical protein